VIKEIINTDIITLIFIVCLICIALSKLIYTKRFEIFSYLVVNNRYTKLFSKDQHFIELFDGILFINLCLNAAIFFYLFINSLVGETISQLLILKYALLIACFFIVKVLLERLLSSIFEIELLIKDYLFTKTSYRNYLGLLLLPINAILIYSVTPNLNTLIIISLLGLTVFSLGLLTFFKANLNVFKRSMFYFILYLCALEIAPYLIVYQFIAIK